MPIQQQNYISLIDWKKNKRKLILQRISIKPAVPMRDICIYPKHIELMLHSHQD